MQSRAKRVFVLVGTRPEAIKMAPVVNGLTRQAPIIETRLVLTGQHTDLVDEALDVFDLTPDHDLNIMQSGQTPQQVGQACLDGLGRLLAGERVDRLLVQGDTASVFFGALAGFFAGVPVGHVEAGLRSGDMAHPFPEEGFRKLTTDLADLHFAPTEGAVRNLESEGVPRSRIHQTGNTVVDAVLRIANDERREVGSAVVEMLRKGAAAGEFRYALLTAHRRESFGVPLERVFEGVRRLIDAEPDLRVVYPVHPNPQVAEPAHRLLGGIERIELVDPLPYVDLVHALESAALVLTDSGGIQEEAPSFGVPVLVLRDVTERPEGIRSGVAELVGTDPDRIIARSRDLLAESDADRSRRRGANPYGDGKAGERIARIVAEDLGVAHSRGPEL